MANFDIFDRLLDPIEGNTADPSEKSIYGITEGAYKDVTGKFKSYKDFTKADATLVRKWFWDKVWASQINNQDVANLVADASFNTGYGQATKHIQRALNEDFGATLKVDGIFGLKTLTALNSVVDKAPDKVFNSIRAKRKNYYLNDCKRPICPSLAHSRLDRYFPEKVTDNSTPTPTASVSTTAVISNAVGALRNPQADKMASAVILGGIGLLVVGVLYFVWNSMQIRKVFLVK